MSTMLAIGVAGSLDSLTVATTRRGQPVEEAVFPRTRLGRKAIRIYLADCEEPFRLAVTSAEVSFACGLAYGRDQQGMVVSRVAAYHASGLALFAAHVLPC